MNNEDAIRRVVKLQNILLQIKLLLWEASELLQGTDEAHSAEASWMAYIIRALDNLHGYSSKMVTMQDTINDLRESIIRERNIASNSRDRFTGGVV